jgi:outer membrane protein with beta-barrel domain
LIGRLLHLSIGRGADKRGVDPQTPERLPLARATSAHSELSLAGLTILSLATASSVLAQALPTASRAGDLQVGAGYAFAKPDYVQQTFQGVSAYADFDLRPHFGIEAEFHQVDTTTGDEMYERTYEIGGRYLRTYGPLVPYVKGMIGRGDFNYPYGLAVLSYNLFAGGAGVDVKLGPYLRVRGEYEYQKWRSFPNGGLAPQIVTIGIAYHFAGRARYR